VQVHPTIPHQNRHYSVVKNSDTPTNPDSLWNANAAETGMGMDYQVIKSRWYLASVPDSLIHGVWY